MTEVAVTVSRSDFGTADAISAVVTLFDVVRVDRLCEARPSTSAVELIEGREERLARNYIYVEAGLGLFPELVLEWRLRRALLRHTILLGCQGRDYVRILSVESHLCSFAKFSKNFIEKASHISTSVAWKIRSSKF